jgi:transcriptional regulator with XRE-family HTH domain
VLISDRLRSIREEKNLSQGDIEKRTGLLRCYVSRVENGHTVPAVETIEKFARALEVPIYQLFYDGDKPPELPNLPKRKTAADIAWGTTGKRCSVSDEVAPSFSQDSGTGQKTPASNGAKDCSPQGRARTRTPSVLTRTGNHGRG